MDELLASSGGEAVGRQIPRIRSGGVVSAIPNGTHTQNQTSCILACVESQSFESTLPVQVSHSTWGAADLPWGSWEGKVRENKAGPDRNFAFNVFI